ncbi:glyceraldehyde 3-phosphate dehydrogenase NAD-binding domain-containing protein, partial [Corynebacterium propinquum]
MTVNQPAEVGHDNWNERIALAQEMIPLISSLHRNNNVVTSIFGRLLISVTDIDIIKAHERAHQVIEEDLPLEQTLPVLRELTSMDLGTASIDVGRLAVGFAQSGATDLSDYLHSELEEVIGGRTNVKEPTDVVLYGFGRIGRLLARILVEREASYGGVRLRAIVVRSKGDGDIIKRASLLRRDSVHGEFNGTISVDEENNIIWANGTKIQVIYANAPQEIDYTSYGINNAIVVDNTGAWRDRKGLSQHLEAKGA